MSVNNGFIEKYLRTDKLPHIWCPGCGNGIVINSLIRAIDNVELEQEKTVVISGIGCSGRASGYLKFCAFQPVHGRVLAYATGIKLYNPELNVICIMGDGDCASIGGNHLIHAARRNIGVTAVVLNNNNYGMTGGQYSPTTPEKSMTRTSPFGHIEPPFDICDLALTSGATYVARSHTYKPRILTKYFQKALTYKGFALVEAMCDCPTLYGRLNKKGSGKEMLIKQKDRAVQLEKAKKMTPEELEDKFTVGEFANKVKPEYTEQYERIIEQVRTEDS